MNLRWKHFFVPAVTAVSLLLGAAELSFDSELKALKSWQKKMAFPDTGVSLAGKPAIRLQNKGSFGKNLELDPDAEYELTYYVKGKDVEPGAQKGTLVLIHGGKAWSRISASEGKKPDSGTFDWRKGKGIIDCKYFKTSKIRIIPIIRGKGVAWYGKFELRKLTPQAKSEKKISFECEWFPANLENGKISFCENRPAQLELITSSKKKYNVKSAELTIIAPEFMELQAVCEAFTKDAAKGRSLSPFTTKKINRNGIRYNSYKVTLDSYFIAWFGESWYRHIAYFKLVAGSVGKSGKLFWSLRIGNEVQPERSMTVRVIEKVKFPEKPCKKFALWIYGISASPVPVPGLREQAQSFWSSLSENRYRGNCGYRDRNIPYPGYKAIVALWGNNFHNNLTNAETQKLLKQMPKNVTDKGVAKAAASSWALLDDEKGIYEKYVRTVLRALKKTYGEISHIWWDFEPHPYGYDEGGRKRFAKAAGLKYVPSIDEINKKYSNQYFNYMVKLHSELIAKNIRFVREELPGTKFWLCSDNLHADTPHVARWCGVDVRLSDDVVDIHNHMPYYAGTRYFDDIAFNVGKLKKPFLPLIDPAERLKSFYTQYSSDKIMQNIVATAALGGIGIGFWPDDLLPGEYFYGISKGFDMVSSAEDFYINGTRCDKDFKVRPRNVFVRKLASGGEITFPDFSSTLRYTVHKLNGRYIATVFNYDAKQTLIVEVSGKGVKPFLVKVEPQGCTIAGPGRLQDQTVLKAEVAKFSGSGNAFKDHVKGKSRVCWSSLSSGTPVLELSNGVITAGVDAFGNCYVVSLRTGSGNEMLQNGFAGRLIFENPLHYNLPFKRIAHGIDAKGIPFVEAEAIIAPYTGGADSVPHPLYGLEIRRRMFLDGKKLVVTHTFNNKSSKAIAIKGRVNTYPWPGYRFKADKVTLGKFDVGVPSEIWLRKPQWKEGNQILAADNGVLKEALLFEPEKGKFDGMFTWTQKSDMPRKTVEFIFDRSIKPGEKWSCTCKISESK